ncbi:unnamed protein product [Toxocara canis]|uniref:WD_REPEATS_REGION domain-containing protein n=1 Tax=Toxocara canis TaxID=6265 RepID=A0A183U927_TOXCA|nr:unnamed protein product [Toxocara canis]
MAVCVCRYGVSWALLWWPLKALSEDGMATNNFNVRAISMLTANLVVSSHLCGRIYVWDLREKSSSLPSLKPTVAYYPTNTPGAIMAISSHPADRHLVCSSIALILFCGIFAWRGGEREERRERFYIGAGFTSKE